MYTFRKIGLALLAIALLMSMSPAFAASTRYGLRTSSAIETSTANILGAGTWVYGLKIYADAANSFAGVYNATTLGACTASTVVDEIGEATQYDSAEVKYTYPKYFADGVSVVMSTGVLFIEYGPEP